MTTQELIARAVAGPVDKDLLQLRVDIAVARTNALQELLEARVKALLPKDAQWNDIDRKTFLEAHCAELEKDYQLLVALEEIVGDYARQTRS